MATTRIAGGMPGPSCISRMAPGATPRTNTFAVHIPYASSQLAILALLHGVEEVLDIPIPLAELPQQSDEWQKLVDEMAAEDDEVIEYIRNLEQRDDELDRTEMHEASGDAIAREFERYLRRRDRGGGHAGGTSRG